MIETIREVKAKYNLDVVTISQSSELSGNYPYKDLGLAFQSDRKIERDEGRKILLDIIRIFLDKINNNPEIQSYLITSPFTEENIGVDVINFHIDISDPSYDNIVSFNLRLKKIYFDYRIPGTEFGTRSEIESLEEAKRLAAEK
jgi:hypothetical protein